MAMCSLNVPSPPLMTLLTLTYQMFFKILSGLACVRSKAIGPYVATSGLTKPCGVYCQHQTIKVRAWVRAHSIKPIMLVCLHISRVTRNK
jgi:hypothetical protein